MSAGSAEGASLAGRIAEIPSEVLGTIRTGFAVAGGLSEEKLQQVIQLLLHQVERAGGPLDRDVIVGATGISRRDASRLNAALFTAIGLLTEGPVSAQEFVLVGRDTLFEQAHAQVAELIANQIVAQRSELRRFLAHQNLAASVLPSLTGFDVAVDLRIKFNETKVEDRVAVAVVHIGTDDRNQRIWLQLTRHDIAGIVSKLNTAAKQMELAEDMVPGTKEG